MYLVDANIRLEQLLGQERSHDAKDFLDRVPSGELFITDFALHPIGLILFRQGRFLEFQQFVEDLFIDGGVHLASLPPEAAGELIAAAETLVWTLTMRISTP